MSRLRVTLVVACIAVVGAVVLANVPAEAAPPKEDCERCWNEWVTWHVDHYFPYNSGPTPCDSGDGCHPGWAEGSCDDAGHTFECEPEVDPDTLFGAVASADVELLRTLLADSDGLQINADRGSFQLVGCAGALIASVPADGQLLEKVNNN